MDILSATLLGVVQGLTEFLPVSSSGHLIVARDLLGLGLENGLAFDAVLQLATALAVVVYFWNDILTLLYNAYRLLMGKGVDPHTRTLLFALVLGTIPAVIFGVLLESYMETAFRSAALVAWVLIAGSLLMLLAEYVHARMNTKNKQAFLNASPSASLTIKKGIAVGFFQVLALVPGMSRSGATISGGLLLGLSREQATRFAFLLSVPIVFGSGMKKMFELENTGALSSEWLPLLLGSLVAFCVGLSAIHFMLRFLRTHTLVPFVIYRVALAGVILFLPFL